MKVLERFSEAKRKLIGIYNELMQKGFIPFRDNDTEITEKYIKESIQNLDEEKFYITVCGQIKCGKSTLLNAIIFREEILPVYDTPWTAKLTEIRYAPEPNFQAIFYNREEWASLMKSEYAEFIKEEIEERAKMGIYPESVIKTPPLVHKSRNFKDLKEYVSAEGKYTPFVREVKIGYPSTFIKDVIIVDTPGTNDPDKFREHQTKEWITKSDAAIYLLYAKQPLHREDIDFINNYFYPILEENIRICINKVDQAEDIESVVEYVENEIKKQLGERKILEGKKLYPISALAALISAMEKDKKELSDELMEFKNKHPEWVKQNGKIDEFIEDVSRHIIEKKGKYIIKTHVQRIKGIMDKKINLIERKLGENEEKLNLISSSEKERLEKKRNYENRLKEINEKVKENFKTEIHNLFESFKEELDSILNEKFTNCQTALWDDINFKPVDWLEANLPWKTKNEIKERVIKPLRDDVRNATEKLKDGLEEIINEYKKKYSDIFKEMIDIWFSPLNVWEIRDKLIERINEELTTEFLEELREYKWIFFTDKEKTKGNYMNELCSFIEELQKDFREECIEKVENDMKSNSEKVFSQIGDYLKSLIDEIERIEKEIKDIEKEKKEMEKKVSELRKERNKFDDIRMGISNRLNEIENTVEMESK